MRIWIDVEDLFQYAAHANRPSGIQRLAFELQHALVELAPQDVRFVRHTASGAGFSCIDFSEIEALFSNLSKPAVPAPPRHAATPRAPGLIRRLGRRLVGTLPPEAAIPLRQFNAQQRAALRSLRDAARACLRPGKTRLAPPRQEAAHDFEAQTAPGDWLLSLGSPWNVEDYAALVRTTCARQGLNFGLLLYDIVPLRRPEWCDRSVTLAFTAWFGSVVPLADQVLAISRTTAEDAAAYAAETGMTLKSRIAPIPLGTGFGQPPAPLRTERLPQAGSFVLFVSTIEARKNHALAFRIWRELLASMPREQVPTLVFAGRVGWLVADLIQQLENADWLGGKIRLIEAPSDGELAAMYEDCLFTLYPSLFEGWGLPVTESLAHGAPCLAANATSLPEAGGALARYFDPDDLHDALRTVRDVLENPAGLAAWRAEIRENFLPVSWRESAAATLRLLGHAC
ncbi:glycosyltransferase [Acidocella aromatica]|uniref:Glycosyltransferase involved in cell wall biosynthesis n=1 Tax=Acidocella aromatica TaxID=1303579 RepID=A0A840VT28_9PROT|nr:glycosyltransferase [Acidocella aromatica]MBB5374470.1 glycosyltransferase involved in cell wall biosynthesis [Acidocella aromatica]